MAARRPTHSREIPQQSVWGLPAGDFVLTTACHELRTHQATQAPTLVKQLAALVPPCQRTPIVITDAGFRTTWFRLIAKQGWHWIGRTRNRDFVRRQGGEWFAAKKLYAKARAKAKDLGEYEAVRNRPLTCRFALIKTKQTGRKL